MPTHTQISIVFDGGSLGNPGTGYGSYRIRHGDEPWGPPVRLEFGARVTNNEAEYRSLIAAIENVKTMAGNPAEVALTVYGDSQLVINHLKGLWRVKAPNLGPLYLQARGILGGFGRTSLVWQPRAKSVALLGH